MTDQIAGAIMGVPSRHWRLCGRLFRESKSTEIGDNSMWSIFIASPYSSPDGERVATNVRDSMVAWHELEEAGFAPFSPLVSHFLQVHKPKPREVWITHDNHWLLKCDCVLRLPGDSEGADGEVALAQRNYIPVFESVADIVEFYRTQPEV